MLTCYKGHGAVNLVGLSERNNVSKWEFLLKVQFTSTCWLYVCASLKPVILERRQTSAQHFAGRLLRLTYLLRLYEVSGDSSSLHVTSFETEARQSEEQSQLSLEPRQKIAPSHVREKPCQNKRTLVFRVQQIVWQRCFAQFVQWDYIQPLWRQKDKHMTRGLFLLKV